MTTREELSTLGRYVLPADVVVTEVAALPAELRDRLDAADGDCAVTRPLGRSHTTVVDGQTALLLQQFRTASTIVDAVLGYSGSAGVDPWRALDEAFAVLRDLILDGLLVAADSPLAAPIAESFRAGDRAGAYTVVELRHLVADTEVYLARGTDGAPAALKVARGSPGAAVRRLLAREAEFLSRHALHGTPRLLDSGVLEGRPYLVTTWCHGVDVLGAADLARALAPGARRAALLGLAGQVLQAYAGLHGRGLLHGDVHPGNTVVGPDGAVTLLDFGLAVDLRAVGAGGARPPRGGVDFFLEPEAAQARLDRSGEPPPSAAGEQYAVGALLYRLLTGAYTHAFSLVPEEMLHQLAEEDPAPFARHGADAVPRVEAVVRRALARSPGERWGSLGELRDAFAGAAAADLAATATRPPAASALAPPAASSGAPHTGRQRDGVSRAAAGLLDEVLARVAAPGPLYDTGLPAPTASLMNGAAGLAYALLRVAQARGDADLLAQADLWGVRARRSIDAPSAFYAPELDITPDVFGANSYCHHAAGVHVAGALVAHARGDEHTGAAAVRDFVQTAAGPCDKLDITFGRSGLLIGCASLLAALPAALDDAALRATGDGLRDALWDRVRDTPPLPDASDDVTLGAAHGWAGYLTALLRWAEASSTPPPDGVDERLDELASLALPAGRGVRWPYRGRHVPPRGGLEASWCNGSAGYVELWSHAYRRHRDEQFLRLATGAAWTAYESRADVGGDLCCGYGGRAYAALGLHRVTGDDQWLARARALADRAVERVVAGSLRPDGLYKGRVGVALLVAELDAGVAGETPLLDGHT